jgi:hypothetical protein
VIPCNSTQYLLLNLDESNGTCVNKKIYKQKCVSHESCRNDLGLQCSDYGCICYEKYSFWNSVLQKCGKYKKQSFSRLKDPFIPK